MARSFKIALPFLGLVLATVLFFQNCGAPLPDVGDSADGAKRSADSGSNGEVAVLSAANLTIQEGGSSEIAVKRTGNALEPLVFNWILESSAAGRFTNTAGQGRFEIGETLVAIPLVASKNQTLEDSSSFQLLISDLAGESSDITVQISVTDTSVAPSGSKRFAPGVHQWIVPQGITSIDVDLGASGGGGDDDSYDKGWNGAHVAGKLPVKPGETININIGVVTQSGPRWFSSPASFSSGGGSFSPVVCQGGGFGYRSCQSCIVATCSGPLGKGDQKGGAGAAGPYGKGGDGWLQINW